VRKPATAGRSSTFLCLFSVCLAWVCSAHAGAALYQFANVPGWVKHAPADYGTSSPPGNGSGGSWYLALDRQYNVRADGSDRYEHSVVKITGSGGLDEYSTLNLHMDPSYETLDLHSIEVIRDGHATEQVHSARITALPEETELRERIYNGRYNINVLLSDVRVGDIIDYAYTTHSRERIFPGQFSARLNIGWSAPIHWQRVRILSPAARELFYRVTDQQTLPPTTLHGNVREFEWEWHDLPGTAADDHRPEWYNPWPDLMVSSSRNWAEVAAPAAQLFAVDERPSAELLNVVADIRKTGGSPEEQALHALQFVQQLRYVSLSIGRGAFRPSSPNTTLSRRFGDCKDKSLLLVTIVRQLGIEADPVLVDTEMGPVLNEVLPTPYTFDHAIARMKIGDRTLWADSTATPQFSALTTHATAGHGWGLVLNEATTALVRIPGPSGEKTTKVSEVMIDLSKGMEAPGSLQVTTSYLDQLADYERENLENDNPQERKSDYINYIVEYYPGAKMSAPIQFSDDKAHNIVKVIEHYELPPVFATQNDRKRFFLQTDELYRYARKPKSSVRSSPLAIAFPVNVRQTIQVILPKKWDLRDSTVAIDNPAFHYISTVRYSDQGPFPRLVLSYQYRSLTDAVEVSALDQYQRDRHRMYENLGFSLREPGRTVLAVRAVEVTTPTALARQPMWVLAFVFLVGGFLALRHGYTWDPESKWIDPAWRVGIRGWLILFVILIVLDVVSWPMTLWILAGNLDVSKWEHLPGSTQAILLWFYGTGVLIEVALILTVFLFFTRRTSAPALVVGTHVTMAAWRLTLQTYEAANHLLGKLDVGDVLSRHWPDWIGVALLAAYFMLSKRVKATFVARYPAQQPKTIWATENQ
jgi:transglutaminase-like putative cysteine protease